MVLRKGQKMNIADFIAFFNSKEEELRELILRKQEEYGSEEDVFQNTRLGAKIARMTSERFIFTQMAKHIAKLARSCETSDFNPVMWDEPINDCIVWLHLLKAIRFPEWQVVPSHVPEVFTTIPLPNVPEVVPPSGKDTPNGA